MFQFARLLLWATGLVVAVAGPALADPFADLVGKLGSEDPDAVVAAISALTASGDSRALRPLEALYDDRLKVAPDGRLFVVEAKTRTLTDAVTGAAVDPAPAGLRDGEMNNQIRRVIGPALASLKLSSPDPEQRRAAALELSRRRDESALGLLRKALGNETDAKTKELLLLAVAQADLASPDAAVRLAAAKTLGDHGDGSVRSDLEALLRKGPDGTPVEPDEKVRAAASSALGSIEVRQTLVATAGHLIYGVSLASVLLFAALGLAITFGVMGVINMAHGEMLTVGAYTTYTVQLLFRRYLPGFEGFYLIAAIPAGFAVATALGVLLERTVIRWLYGRPLETLLATWGISLGLIQTIRLLFGASNVAVENPPWLSGGVELAQGLVLSYNRLGVVLFVIAAAALVWFLLRRTRLGLTMRAVTQNRGMAASLGVRTSRVDMWTFGLGSGIAGLGGVALSQIGNVGPELGQSYILDSFMVVVLGGVGRIAGTIGAAVGLGLTQKLLEPMAGAVLGKIAVLVVVILFIQRRPQGLFPVKGRVEV